jgi:hypothetical protein
MSEFNTSAFGFDFRSRTERIARLDALATLLDTAALIPGTNIRFGLDALVGLVPGIGDATPPPCRSISCMRRGSSARRLM